MSPGTGSPDPGIARVDVDIDAEHELDLYRRMQLIRRFSNT